MSREARAWVWDATEIDDPRTLLIIHSIADVADEWGWGAYPSVPRLAKDSRGGERTVQRHLRELIESGILEVTKAGGGRRPTTYRIVPMDPEREHEPHTTPAKVAPLRKVTKTEPTPVRGANTPPIPRHSGDRGVTFGEPSPLIGTGSGTGSTSPPDLFKRFWQAYPLRLDRKAAETAWTRALKRSKTDPETLIEAAEAYAADPNREDVYTKRAATWLNGDCWTNGPLPPRPVNRNGKPKPNRNVMTDRSGEPGRVYL